MITFTQTCDKLYDRHKYKLFYTNGQIELFDHYEDVYTRWMQLPSNLLSHVEVVDRKKRRG